MKNMLKLFALAAFSFMISTGTSLAQSPVTTTTSTEIPDAGKMKKNLTDEQKALIQKAQDERRAAHEAFKATLTDEQKAILANKDLSNEAKREALKATLSDAQKALWKANQAAKDEFKDAMKASLTDEQKMKRQDMKEKHQERMKNLTDDQKAKMKEEMQKSKGNNKMNMGSH